jgi:hypothetical protein
MCDETVMKVNSRYKVYIIRMVCNSVHFSCSAGCPWLCMCSIFLLTESLWIYMYVVSAYLLCNTELILFVHSNLTSGNVSCMWGVLVLNHGWDTNYFDWSKIWGFANVDVVASFGTSGINNHNTGLNNSEALNPHHDWSLSWFISVPSFKYRLKFMCFPLL